MVTSTASTGSRSGPKAVSVVEVRGLTKEFGRVPALCGLDLDVPAGSIHCLIGPAGSGKTAALSIIAGLAHPTRGTVRVCGIDVARDPARARRHIGFLRQRPRFYTWMTGRETLQFTGRFFTIGAARLEQREYELLERTGLVNAAGVPVEEYTAGMRQRLGIAQALMGRPGLLLLDEPAAGLGAVERSQIASIIERLRGVATILFTSDGSAEIDALADAITVLPGSGS